MVCDLLEEKNTEKTIKTEIKTQRKNVVCVSGYRHDHILTLPVLYSSLRQVEGIGRPKHCSGQIKSLTPTHQ